MSEYSIDNDTRMDFRFKDRDSGVYGDIATSPRPGTVAYPGADKFIPLRLNLENGSLETRAYAQTNSISSGIDYSALRAEGGYSLNVPTSGRLS
jgi:hypothetical protein